MGCTHSHNELLRVQYVDHTMFYSVCRDCGKTTAIHAEEALEAYGSDAYECRIVSSYFIEMKLGRTGKRKYRRREYREYLKSQEWKVKRQMVLERDEYTCRKCNSAAAVQVHHTTYKNVFREELRDLISICEACHEGIHRQH